MVFITAGMGGGTGTGAGPVVARIAKERGLLTIGIVTIPFLFEGEKKILKALEGADEMSKYVDALLIINNDRLTEIYKDFDFVNAFGKADDTLSTAAQSISEIITCDGYMNLDFNDVDTTLRDGGTAIISSGYGEGENRVSKAIQDALHSPLLKNRDILGSKRLLFNLYFNPKAEKAFKIEETNELTAFISQLDSDVDVIWGASFNEDLGDKVKITILAAGFDVTTGATPQPPVISVPEPKNEPAKHPEVQQQPMVTDRAKLINEQRLTEEYGKGRINEYRTAQTSAKYIVLKPSQLDDDNILDTLESTPAFNRDKRIIDQVKSNSNDQPERNNNPLKGSNTIVF
jgi:cell division protein FtsZ